MTRCNSRYKSEFFYDRISRRVFFRISAFHRVSPRNPQSIVPPEQNTEPGAQRQTVLLQLLIASRATGLNNWLADKFTSERATNFFASSCHAHARSARGRARQCSVNDLCRSLGTGFHWRGSWTIVIRGIMHDIMPALHYDVVPDSCIRA